MDLDELDSWLAWDSPRYFGIVHLGFLVIRTIPNGGEWTRCNIVLHDYFYMLSYPGM